MIHDIFLVFEGGVNDPWIFIEIITPKAFQAKRERNNVSSIIVFLYSVARNPLMIVNNLNERTRSIFMIKCRNDQFL